jgi:anti-anti-sigma factor
MAEISIQENTVYLSGELKIKSVKSLWDQVNQYVQKNGRSDIMIDLAGVTSIDSAGVALLDEIKSTCSLKAITIELLNVPSNIQEAINSFSTEQLPAETIPPKVSFFESIGEYALRMNKNFIGLL